MLQKLLLICCLLSASSSFGQYKICKDYYSSTNDGHKTKTLSSVTYYDEHQNIIRQVSMNDDATVFDTTDYFYENNLLVKKVRYWKVDPVSRPADTVLNYIKKHPAALGQPLHNIVKLHLSDTEMTRYYYDARGLPVKKEYAMFSSQNQSRGNYSLKRKLADIKSTYSTPQRTWQDQRVTNYIYNENNKLVEAGGDLFDDEFCDYSQYIASARRYFYNSKNQIILDSIVSYNGKKFDGAVRTYNYLPDGYEVRRVKFADIDPQYSLLVFKLNAEGKIQEEACYDLKSAEDRVDDSPTPRGKKVLYEYDSMGRLIKKSDFYYNTEPSGIHYYTYE